VEVNFIMKSLDVATSQSVSQWTCESVANRDTADLAYLTLSGKVELPIRDHLAAWCASNFPDVTAAREWRFHDLALLGDAGPEVIIEGKLWGSFNVLNDSKLMSRSEHHGIRGAMEKDIQKIVKTSRESACKGFISTLIMGIDVSAVSGRNQQAVKYLPYWLKVGHRAGTMMETQSAACCALSNFASNYGQTETAEVFSGAAYGAQVTLSVVVTQVC